MAIDRKLYNQKIQEIQDSLESIKVTPETTMRDDELICVLGAIQNCTMEDLIEELEATMEDPSNQQPKTKIKNNL